MLDIVKEILKANPAAYLSGSLALQLQGYTLIRNPKDIDIWVNHIQNFDPIAGMVEDDENRLDTYHEKKP